MAYIEKELQQAGLYERNYTGPMNKIDKINYDAIQEKICAAHASISTKEGEVKRRLTELEMKINILHNSVCKIKDILEPVLFIKPSVAPKQCNDIGPDRTQIGGRINNLSGCVDAIQSVADDILNGIEI
jgi:hypothetical protein